MARQTPAMSVSRSPIGVVLRRCCTSAARLAAASVTAYTRTPRNARRALSRSASDSSPRHSSKEDSHGGGSEPARSEKSCDAAVRALPLQEVQEDVGVGNRYPAVHGVSRAAWTRARSPLAFSVPATARASRMSPAEGADGSSVPSS
ncbi:MAG: hypothetical protein A2V77_23090 [Anaeromyxobacter sp. RBG_16_69_14]|nr:MAG: hypothetical protein A2V77_23090 [Anaeromyxobacter sp. RBG_16_69_14]